MCHHSERTIRWDERAEDIEAEDDDWTPDEFEAEGDVEVDLLTDGGDE
ncbi:hypothetical protein [Haloplanus pelagicus]|jgi:hypothetical protein|nr:hypothetical protein [Haloplanus sp. HW8-1]